MIKAYAPTRAKAGALVQRALGYTLEVTVTDVGGSEDCWAVKFDETAMGFAELAEVLNGAEYVL